MVVYRILADQLGECVPIGRHRDILLFVGLLSWRSVTSKDMVGTDMYQRYRAEGIGQCQRLSLIHI